MWKEKIITNENIFNHFLFKKFQTCSKIIRGKNMLIFMLKLKDYFFINNINIYCYIKLIIVVDIHRVCK